MTDRPRRKVYMMLRLKGRDLDPADVTASLRLTPTVAFRRGDMFKARENSYPRAYGMWMLSTEGAVDSQDLADHYQCLLQWVTPVRPQLDALRARGQIEATVAFWWEPADGPVGFTFPSAEFRTLAELCDDFDFYFA